MPTQKKRVHIGLRTIKTAAAVVVSMMIVDAYGATTSKLIFAMLGAMAAVQPTFKESLASCLTQIIGVIFGALVGGYALSRVYIGVMNIMADPAIMSAGVVIPLVISGVFALAAMLVIAVMLPLGMYFPQLDVNTWLVTTWDIIFHAPLQCLVVVALMWFPLALLIFEGLLYVYTFGLVFLAVYFVLVTFIATILLKKSLLRILKLYPREEEE